MTKEAWLYNVEKTVYSINGAGKAGQLHVKKRKLEHSLPPYTKISSKWIKDINVRPDSIKCLEENIGRTLWHKLQQYLFWSVSQDNGNKSKSKQMGPNQTEKLLHSKGNHKQKEKTTHRLGENICKWCDPEGLVSKIYKQLMQLNVIKTNNPIKKWAKELNRDFSKEDTQMARRHMKRCSTSLIIREL